MKERVKESGGEEGLLQCGVHTETQTLIETIERLVHLASVRDLKLIVRFIKRLIK